MNESRTLAGDLRTTLPFCIAFALLFAVCYGSASWLTGTYTQLSAWDLPIESRIPFVPAMSLVYLTITPALMLAPLLLRRRSELAPFAAALSIETLIAFVFFLLFPLTTAFVRPEVTGWARIPLWIADVLNLNYNEFPSLHVAFACSAAWAYAARSQILGRIGWILWSVAVAASTSLMWEHHFSAILGGVVLALLVMGFVYPRMQRPALQQTAWVELCCLRQCMLFSRRHPRYFIIFLSIYAPSLLHWRRYRAVRTGFCAAQWIDDLLDGDRPCAGEPLDVIEELVSEMQRGEFSREPLSRLTGAFFAELPTTGRSELIALVRTMQRDRKRVLDHEVWSEAQLDEHHRATFQLSVNLMLRAAGSFPHADQVPSLIEALAWCSVFRDLDEDLRKGLINVPRQAWKTTPEAYRDWVRNSHDRATIAIARAGKEIIALHDVRARRILGIFQSSIAKFERRFGSSI